MWIRYRCRDGYSIGLSYLVIIFLFAFIQKISASMTQSIWIQQVEIIPDLVTQPNTSTHQANY